MGMFILKLVISIIIWIIAHKICEAYPFEWMDISTPLKPFDYYDFYTTVYLFAFLGVFAVLSLL